MDPCPPNFTVYNYCSRDICSTQFAEPSKGRKKSALKKQGKEFSMSESKKKKKRRGKGRKDLKRGKTMENIWENRRKGNTVLKRTNQVKKTT